MIHKAHKLAVIALVIIGSAAGFLHARGRDQQLGQPGLVLNLDPLADEESLRKRTNAIQFPLRVLGYEAVPGTISEPELKNLPADTGFGRALYQDPIDGFEAQLSAVIMGTDRTSIHRPQQCLPWQGWSILNQQEIPVRFQSEGEEKTLKVQRIDARTQRVIAGRPVDFHAVYVYWYVADGLVASTHSSRHLQTIKELLVNGTLPRWAYISYFTVCPSDGQDAAFERLTRLIAATVPQFQRPDFLDASQTSDRNETQN